MERRSLRETLKLLAQRFVANIDGPLFAIALCIIVLGLFTLYSATKDSPARFNAQLLNIGVAVVAMWVAAQLSPLMLERLAVPIYVAGLALLVGVAVAGDVVNGARRWLHVGITRIQPSEIMKIAMPLMLAWFFHRYEGTLRLREFIGAAVLLLIPTALIARQPDLGTALLVAGAGFYAIFLAGLSWRVMITLGVAGVASLPFLWTVLHDYQRRRILTLLDPTQDPLGAGYHTIQSTIAVGSGGLLGKGWLNGTQTHLEFIPERHTDFIFAVLSEEFGLLGNIVLVLLYVALITRGMVIASNAPTFFSRLLAGTLVLMFFTYAFVNMGMVSGVLPVVGVPLPLVSYGGTALVTLFIGIGILMSVASRRTLVQS
jgi:rod shape determining protein RodA